MRRVFNSSQRCIQTGLHQRGTRYAVGIASVYGTYKFASSRIYTKRDCSTEAQVHQVHDYRSVLGKIDEEIGVDENSPFIEYIFTKPMWWDKTISGYNFAGNPYGHALIRYRLPNGEDKIMNICGKKGCSLVNFFDPSKYFFTSETTDGNEQGGIFNRSFITIRVDDVSDEDVYKLDEYYNKINTMNNNNEAEFGAALHYITNRFRPLFHKTLRGNCANWTSEGLVKAGLLEKQSYYPLVIWMKLFLNEMKRKDDKTRMNIIEYRSIKYEDEPKGSLIYPFYWLKHKYQDIWYLSGFANITIEPQVVTSDVNSVHGGVVTLKDHDQSDQFSHVEVDIIREDNIKETWNELRQKMTNVFGK
jgi:hypothetical protein